MRKVNEALRRENSRLEHINKLESEIEYKKGQHPNEGVRRIEQECNKLKKVLQNCK